MDFQTGTTGYNDDGNGSYPDYLYLHDLMLKSPMILGRDLSVFPPLNYEHGQILNQKISEGPWSPIRIASRSNKGPLDQYTNGSLSGEENDLTSWQPARTAGYRECADSPCDSRVSCETQSMGSLSWSGESVRSPSVMSIRSALTETKPLVLDHSPCFEFAIPVAPAAADESLTCSRCPWWVASTPSEKRKHDARHNAREKKAHKCEHCNKSFGTRNDLERHQKAVHRKTSSSGPPKSFKCFGCGCERSNKLLSRWDNLKAHIQRKHENEDAEKLMRLSQEWYKKCVAESGTGKFTTDELGISDDGHSTDLDTLDDGGAPRKRLKREESSTNVLGEISSLTDDKAIGHSLHCSYRDRNASPEGSVDSTVSVKKLPCIRSVLNSEISSESDSPEDQAGALPSMRSLDRGIALFKTLALQKLRKEEHACQQQNERIILDARQTEDEPNDHVTSIGDLPAREKAFLLSLVSDMKSELTQHMSQDNESVQSNGQQPGSNTGRFGRADFTCSECNKVFARQCDFRKHVARHEKRYGCTFPDCFRVFGSKADWKRHENTRHFHCRGFRCFLPSKEHLECAQQFFSEEKYREHLTNCHAVVDTKEIDSQVSRNQIGKNGQNQFWCGFCRQIKRLKSKGLDAWKERFDHIDSEHFRKGQKIGDWLPPSGHLVKSELEKRQQGNGKLEKKEVESNQDEEFMSDSQEYEPGNLPDDENPVENSGGGDDRETLEDRPAAASNNIDVDYEPVSPNPDAPEENIQAPFVPAETSQKREATSYPPVHSQAVYCCYCFSGPHLSSINAHCPECGARFCINCPIEMVAR